MADVSRTLIFLLLLGAVALFVTRSDDEFAGEARVIDGDSLSVDGREVRLFGIDAPEFHQLCFAAEAQGEPYSCGKRATAALDELIDGNTVMCRAMRSDKYGRLIAVCEIDGLELNREMVVRGWAVAFGGYALEEMRAKERKTGLWQGDFELPSDWRRAEKNIINQSGSGWLFGW